MGCDEECLPGITGIPDIMIYMICWIPDSRVSFHDMQFVNKVFVGNVIHVLIVFFVFVVRVLH